MTFLISAYLHIYKYAKEWKSQSRVIHGFAIATASYNTVKVILTNLIGFVTITITRSVAINDGQDFIRKICFVCLAG